MSRFEESGTGQGGAAESAAQQVRQGASQIGQQVREMGSQVKEAAQQQYSQVRDTAAEYYEQGRQRAMELEESIEEYVREQPIKSLLIAAGVGMLLGILWRRS